MALAATALTEPYRASGGRLRLIVGIRAIVSPLGLFVGCRRWSDAPRRISLVRKARAGETLERHRLCHSGVCRADGGGIRNWLGAGAQRLPAQRRGRLADRRDPQSDFRRLNAGAERWHLYTCLQSLFTVCAASRRLAGVGRRADRIRFLLLLEPSHRPRGRPLLGGACGASPERGLQSLDCAEAAELGGAARLDLLSADGDRRRPAGRVRRRRADRPSLSVLDSHRARRQARLVRSRVRLALEPPRASRRQRPLSRQELRRHPDHLGPPVRHLRGRGRACRLWRARGSQHVRPDLGQPLLLRDHG